MLTKVLDLQEAQQYDSFSDEKFRETRKNQETVDLTGGCKFHTDPEMFDSTREVKMRFLHDAMSPVDFKDGAV